MANNWGRSEQHTTLSQRENDWDVNPAPTRAKENWNDTQPSSTRNNTWRSDRSHLSRSRIGTITSSKSGYEPNILEISKAGRSEGSWESGNQSNGRRSHWEGSRDASMSPRRGGNSDWKSQRRQNENELNWELELDRNENERRWEVERQRAENDRRWEAESRREVNERNWEIERQREENERNSHLPIQWKPAKASIRGDDKPLPTIPVENSQEDDRLSRRDSFDNIGPTRHDFSTPVLISRPATLQEEPANGQNSQLGLRGGGTGSQYSGSVEMDTPSTARSEGLENGFRPRRTSSTARRLVLTFRPQRPPRTEPTSPPSNSIPVSPMSATQVRTERSLPNSIDITSQLSMVSIIKYHDKDVQCDFDERPRRRKRQPGGDETLPTGSRLAILLVCTCMAIFLQALVSIQTLEDGRI
jgi:hypothetical protein